MRIVSGKFLLLMLAFFLAAGFFLSADPVEGYWKSVDEDGEPTAFWQIYIEDGMAFGRIVKIIGKPQDSIADKVEASYPDHPVSGQLNTMRVVDVPWIYNLEPRRNEGEWTKGHIIDPNDGKRYALDLNFIPADHRKAVDGQETLEVKGKILMFARSQYWVRSSRAEVDSYQE
ncbi:DUF2147 domain-containing protein [Salinispira pacifica]|uniref:DUF2147 domain-containing protein n=1 Tax=Salinispira pacifica TaxID=1307761 RepID=V5WF02_9SPIO|nr:DUF2147 domain-containing protein [Salinispira pacifica]AHC13751.1 hypothetical protein L21SP2_0311 [Salinispira pacifica]